MARRKAIANKALLEKGDESYRCFMCGKEYTSLTGKFFKISYSKRWKANGGFAPFCKDCVNEKFEEYTKRYGSERIALQVVCADLDVPFVNSLFDSIKDNNNIFNPGLYLRQMQMRQYQNKDFGTTLTSKELYKDKDEIKQEAEEKWSRTDKQNMSYSISVVGFDPFEDCGMTNSDRKYAFGILSGYLDSEGIQEDGYKIQSVVQMCQSQLQCKKIDEMINTELLSKNPDKDQVKILTATKKQLQDSIATIAKDNNIASAYNKNSTQGHNTLSLKMKEIASNGFEDIKVNLFDIKTAECMKQVAKLSTEAIFEQIPPDANDYTSMLKEQREMIEQYREKTDELEEENRNLKNKIEDAAQKKRR